MKSEPFRRADAYRRWPADRRIRATATNVTRVLMKGIALQNSSNARRSDKHTQRKDTARRSTGRRQPQAYPAVVELLTQHP